MKCKINNQQLHFLNVIDSVPICHGLSVGPDWVCRGCSESFETGTVPFWETVEHFILNMWTSIFIAKQSAGEMLL